MDAARTAEHRGFRGLPTSKSSSSRSCGDTCLRPAPRDSTSPGGSWGGPPQGLTGRFPGGPVGNRGTTSGPGSQPPPRATAGDGSSGGSRAGRWGPRRSRRSRGARQALPGPARRRRWPPARRRSSRTPPRSSYLRGEHTEGAAPPDSDRCPGNEAATRGACAGGGWGWGMGCAGRGRGAGGHHRTPLPHGVPPAAQRAAQPGPPAVTSGDSEPTRDAGDRHTKTHVPAQGAPRSTP